MSVLGKVRKSIVKGTAMTDWNKTCFITGNAMSDSDHARFTSEFDAWVSEEGQRIVEERATSAKTASMMTPSQKSQHQEAYIIYREWYAQDAAAEAREQERLEAQHGNDEFRSWHK